MLKDINLKYNYTSGVHEPRLFFTEALIESIKFDLGLGFFSSSGIRSLSTGFALFIANGGVMRVIINHILSEKDKSAIEKGNRLHKLDIIEEEILRDVKKLSNVLSLENTHFFNCFSYLISIKKIEFIATVSSKGGMVHNKYGIFTDEIGDKISFIGSTNWSKTALECNNETITVFSSWEEPKRVSEYQKLFNESWTKKNPDIIHIPLNKVKTHVLNKFTCNDLDSLIKEELLIINQNNNKVVSNIKTFDLPEYLKSKIINKMHKPRFPFPHKRQIQIDAYEAWKKNNYKGIFAMATGTGKTVTALNCVLEQYINKGFYKAIIVVPTQALAIQWENEANFFNFQNIISTHTTKNWKNKLSRYITRTLISKNKDLILITTYATFNRQNIQQFISKKTTVEDMIYIADEAHNLGSPTSLKNLPLQIHKRIGLSATPERVYDETGSNEVFSFFNSQPPKYTYRFSMRQAIDNNILCNYEYFPIFVELTIEEMNSYKEVTKQLRKFIDTKTGKYSKDAEMLLLKRKRIIHKAANKKNELIKLVKKLDEQQKLNYTFVFVPEGFEPNYSENDYYKTQEEDIKLIDEYSNIFKTKGYNYHQYTAGIKDSEQILNLFESGKIQILLSMKCLDEGVDIPKAKNAIFCSSTGNPRQFIQRRGRVLRKAKGKEKAYIWDLIVVPPTPENEDKNIERNLFLGEVKRVVNFASLADNWINIIYGELKYICDFYNINLFNILDKQNKSN